MVRSTYDSLASIDVKSPQKDIKVGYMNLLGLKNEVLLSMSKFPPETRMHLHISVPSSPGKSISFLVAQVFQQI